MIKFFIIVVINGLTFFTLSQLGHGKLVLVFLFCVEDNKDIREFFLALVHLVKALFESSDTFDMIGFSY